MMQTAESLSYEAIPSRFCEDGAYAAISRTPEDDFSFQQGFSVSFSNPGTYIRRQHVNAVGRIGTSAQALLQSGDTIGHVSGIAYGDKSVVTIFDGMTIITWVSTVDGNTTSPLGKGENTSFIVTESADVSASLPPELTNWALACPELSNGFFDV